MEYQKENLNKKWLERVKKAEKEHCEYLDEFRVKASRLYYEGKQQIPGTNKNEWITINKIYSHLQSQLPALYSIDPYFYVKPTKAMTANTQTIGDLELAAKIRENHLNYLKKELSLKEKARLAIQDAHFSYGVIKVKYTTDMKKNPDAGKPVMDDDENPMMDEKGEEMYEPDYIPINERYEIIRVHPDDIIIGCDGGPIEDRWPFVAERIKLTREQAINDTRIGPKKIRKIEKAKKGDGYEESKDTDYDVFCFYEVYDLRNKKFMILSEYGDEMIIKPSPLPEGVEDHPYAILRFTLRDNSPYPIPPISQAMDQQDEYNQARSSVLTHRKRFNRKYEVNIHQLEDPETEMSKLEAGGDGTIIKVMGLGAVNPINDAPMDQGRYLEIQALNNDMIEILGSPDQARGVSSAETATEAGIIDRRLEIREGDRLSIVTDWLTVIAKKLDQLVQANIERDEAIRISGPQGEGWVLVKKEAYDEEIPGEFSYEVVLGSTTPRLPQIERSQWTAFMMMIAQFPQLLRSKRFMKKSAEMYGIQDEAMVDELVNLGNQMNEEQVQGQAPTSGVEGVPMMNPATMLGGPMGAAMGGLTNGGGNAPV